MSADGSQQDRLNVQSGFILAVFIVVSFFVIRPVRIPLASPIQRILLSCLQFSRIIGQEEFKSLSTRRLHFPLSLETAPVIAVFLLLATNTIHGSTVALGIKGDENVKPYDVLVLFISLAYISIALDGTGALEAIAFWVSKRGGSSGRRLFAVLYSFFLLAGCLVGNDPLILSGTPFLAYLTKHTGLEPTAWIFSEFMAANIASAVLVSSNPTNILITGSFSLNYLTEFTKWTILPSIIPALINFPILLCMFHKQIPRTLVQLQENPWSKLRNARAAVFFSSLMLITLTVLVGTTFVPGGAVQVWMVTAPAGILAFLFNICTDFWNSRKRRKEFEEKEENVRPDGKLQPMEESTEKNDGEQSPRFTPSADTSLIKVETTGNLSHSDRTSTILEPPTVVHGPNDGVLPEQQSIPTPLPPCPSASFESDISSPARTVRATNPTLESFEEKTFTSFLQYLSQTLPTTTQTVSRLPLPLLPFAASYFILTRGLAQRNWIPVFAIGLSRACTSVFATVFLFGFLCSAFLCPLAGTNIGATIILVEILQDPHFQGAPTVSSHPEVLKGAIYATALGSNLGAFSYTFSGSLAGLLWRGLLKQKGVEVSAWKFVAVNVLPLVVQTGVACLILWGEVYWFT